MSYTVSDGVLIKYTPEPGVAAAVVPENVSEIAPHAFSWCSGLKKIVLPEGLKTIGAFAFSGCTALEELELPESVLMIGHSAFDGCRSLKRVSLPEGLESAGSYLFGTYGVNPELALTVKGEVKSLDLTSFSGPSTIAAPRLPLNPSLTEAARLPWLGGFVTCPELYNEELTREYTEFVLAGKGRVLKKYLEKDDVSLLRALAEKGALTEDKIDSVFIGPAAALNATRCTAFLLEWKNRNIKKTNLFEEFEL